MEERNIKVSLEEAKKWYKHGGFPKNLALKVFSKEELEEPNLPKSWEEFGKSGYLSSRYFKYTNQIDTLEKLLILRDVYRQGWKPDYRNFSETKYSICLDRNVITIIKHYTGADLFSFQSEELAKQFLENFKEELEQLKELL